MSFQDKTIKCADCGSDFTFSAEEQEFFKTKGFTNEPKRCPTCRQAKKSEQRGGGYSSRTELYPAVCAQCGKETQVPFQPRGDKPVYCSQCYSKVRGPR
ncbi:MAG: zinc-ribbon domain containing protein [Dehalococcoidia bacterium]|nr:zinc-ribbon domain containing protein [Dehalococcoidia bacterium]MDD5494417.1 zinc-ribbon domain containing protein [Dehalococcoidia bacterium]